MTVPISSLRALVTSLAVGSPHNLPSAAGQEAPEFFVEHPETETFPFLFRLDGHNEMLSKGFPMSLASLSITAMQQGGSSCLPVLTAALHLLSGISDTTAPHLPSPPPQHSALLPL